VGPGGLGAWGRLRAFGGFLPHRLPGRTMTTAVSDAVPSGYAGRDVWGAFIGGAFAGAGDSETFE